MKTINELLKKEPNINKVFRHLKPVQVLTDDSIYLLEKVKMYLSTYNDNLPTEATTKILVEFGELIKSLKEETI